MVEGEHWKIYPWLTTAAASWNTSLQLRGAESKNDPTPQWESGWYITCR